MKRPWVIKAGGELLTLPDVRRRIFHHLAQVRKKVPVVFVHGGGPQIEEELKKQNIHNQFVNGRRVTSPAAMVVIEQVLSGQINKGIVAELVQLKVKAVGLSCRDGGMVVADPLPGLERAAAPKKIDTTLLAALCAKGFLPVVSSVGSDKEGHAVNINADDVASVLAIALKAQNLVFLTNIGGVLDGEKKRIPILKTKNIDYLIAESVISGGMIPKVQSARAAIHKGVGEIDIVNGKDGIDFNTGTRIVK
jgi:acetylglutamate kinase